MTVVSKQAFVHRFLEKTISFEAHLQTIFLLLSIKLKD